MQILGPREVGKLGFGGKGGKKDGKSRRRGMVTAAQVMNESSQHRDGLP